jgi:hypothetical protein
VYAVADEEEAKALIVLCCGTNLRGEYVADELVHEQTLENLERFSDRLDRGHELMKKNGQCRCHLTPEPAPKQSRKRVKA